MKSIVRINAHINSFGTLGSPMFPNGGGKNMLTSWKSPKKKKSGKKKSNKKSAEETEAHDQNAAEGLRSQSRDGGYSGSEDAQRSGEGRECHSGSGDVQRPGSGVDRIQINKAAGGQYTKLPNGQYVNLAEAMVWTELLGEPAYRKRRRKRMEQQYGNQGYADRR